FAAWGFVPLRSLESESEYRSESASASGPGSASGSGSPSGLGSAAEAARRLRLLANAYGGLEAEDVLAAVPDRLRTSVERIRAGVLSGDPGMRRLSDTGVVGTVEQALAALAAREPEIRREIARQA
ncbi:MAG TPA: hypothetical protein VE287_13000, partial [Actinopolymorphaceae bacterium]|nr:hypothetical protein [Actinopolymorphaceae bacterium]